MEWLQSFMIAGSTIGACWWMHRESRSDHKEFQREMREFHNAMKDFHGRLCTLEERHLNMMQRIFERKDL